MDHYTWSQRAPRTPASLISGGVLLSLVAGLFHPDRAPANDHAAAFAEYAHSGAWIAVHLGQFVGMMVIVAGLLALFLVLNGQPGRSVWAGPFGAAAAVLALGLYGVLQAVDGVALKHAVDAWATAPEAERAARFASAETIRWLEHQSQRPRTGLAREAEIRVLRDRYASLTPREREVMALVISGRLNKQVGGELGISEITVKAHRGKMMRKMKADSLPLR